MLEARLQRVGLTLRQAADAPCSASPDRHFRIPIPQQMPFTHHACYHAFKMDEKIHPKQLEDFRRMTPAQKLRMVADLYEAGIQLRVAGLHIAHPDWPPERLDRHARESLRHAGT